MPTQYTIADGQQVSTRVLEAVADYNGVDPLELRPPLYEIIDPEALEALFAPTAAGAERNGRIEFTYADCRITLAAGAEGTITVDDATASARGLDRGSEPGQRQSLD